MRGAPFLCRQSVFLREVPLDDLGLGFPRYHWKSTRLGMRDCATTSYLPEVALRESEPGCEMLERGARDSASHVQ